MEWNTDFFPQTFKDIKTILSLYAVQKKTVGQIWSLVCSLLTLFYILKNIPPTALYSGWGAGAQSGNGSGNEVHHQSVMD